MPRLVDLNVYGASYTPKRDNVCKLFVLGYDLCIIKYHVQCKWFQVSRFCYMLMKYSCDRRCKERKVVLQTGCFDGCVCSFR